MIKMKLVVQVALFLLLFSCGDGENQSENSSRAEETTSCSTYLLLQEDSPEAVDIANDDDVIAVYRENGTLEFLSSPSGNCHILTTDDSNHSSEKALKYVVSAKGESIYTLEVSIYTRDAKGNFSSKTANLGSFELSAENKDQLRTKVNEILMRSTFK